MKLTTRENVRLVIEGVITVGIIFLMYLSIYQIMTVSVRYILNHTENVWFESVMRQFERQHFWGMTPYVGVFLVITMGILVYWRLKRRVRQYEIRHIIDELHYIAKGHFHHRITGTYQDDVEKVIESIHLLVDSAVKAMEEERLIEQSKDELITNVSHDIRTPLTSIIGYLGLIEQKRYHSEEELVGYVSVAFCKAKQMKYLVDDLFEYTTVRQTTTPLNVTTFDMVQLLEQLIIDFDLEAQRCGMRINVITQKPSVRMQGDAEKLVRVMNNLISNALKYAKNGTMVMIEVSKQHDSHVQVIVKNNGNTLPAHRTKHIFERFYREETSRSQEIKGTGLGLAISQGIIQLHKGSISARIEGDWTLFEVQLPIRQQSVI